MATISSTKQRISSALKSFKIGMQTRSATRIRSWLSQFTDVHSAQGEARHIERQNGALTLVLLIELPVGQVSTTQGQEIAIHSFTPATKTG